MLQRCSSSWSVARHSVVVSLSGLTMEFSRGAGGAKRRVRRRLQRLVRPDTHQRLNERTVSTNAIFCFVAHTIPCLLPGQPKRYGRQCKGCCVSEALERQSIVCSAPLCGTTFPTKYHSDNKNRNLNLLCFNAALPHGPWHGVQLWCLCQA